MHVGYLNIVIIAAEGDRHLYFPNLFQSEYLFGILYLKTKCVPKYDFFPKNDKSTCRKINLSVRPWKLTINYKDATLMP